MGGLSLGSNSLAILLGRSSIRSTIISRVAGGVICEVHRSIWHFTPRASIAVILLRQVRT